MHPVLYRRLLESVTTALKIHALPEQLMTGLFQIHQPNGDGVVTEPVVEEIVEHVQQQGREHVITRYETDVQQEHQMMGLSLILHAIGDGVVTEVQTAERVN